MKSNKQRRAEIKAHRLARAARVEAQPHVRYRQTSVCLCVLGIEQADLDVLGRYNNTYVPLPEFYFARPFICRDCGAEEVWTAKQQKWWYEVMHASIESKAVRCLACRRARRASHAASREGEGANLLGNASARLRVLACSAPTRDVRAEVNAALESKWWSLRVLAVAALGRWGTADDIARLRAFVGAYRPSWGSWEGVRADAAAKALSERPRMMASQTD